MEVVNCSYCNSKDYKVIFTNNKDSFRDGKFNGKTRFVVCKNCGLVYQNPRLTEEERTRIYEVYWKRDPAEYDQAGLTADRERTKWIMSNLPPGYLHGKILDIGCSTGKLLNYFLINKWDTYGVEAVREYAEYGKTKHDHKIEAGFFNKMSVENERFDLITASHVLEHDPDPFNFLENVRVKLKDKGYFFIEVPNVKRISNNPFDIYCCPHFFCFSIKTLRNFLQKKGFVVVKAKRCDRGIRLLAYKGNRLFEDSIQDKKDNYRLILVIIIISRLIHPFNRLCNYLLLFIKKVIKAVLILFLGDNKYKQLRKWLFR